MVTARLITHRLKNKFTCGSFMGLADHLASATRFSSFFVGQKDTKKGGDERRAHGPGLITLLGVLLHYSVWQTVQFVDIKKHLTYPLYIICPVFCGNQTHHFHQSIIFLSMCIFLSLLQWKELKLLS